MLTDVAGRAPSKDDGTVGTAGSPFAQGRRSHSHARTAGSIAGFNYSKANKESGVTWSEDVLFTYLEAPAKFMPGTRMAFGGLKNPQDRADVIAYLKTKA
jgi:hypothetical protein